MSRRTGTYKRCSLCRRRFLHTTYTVCRVCRRAIRGHAELDRELLERVGREAA